MTETVIKVENLSKQYRIGAKESYKTFRETLIDAAKALAMTAVDLVTKSDIASKVRGEFNQQK